MQDAVAQTPSEAGLERTGSRALSIFARVLSAQVLRAHADGPLSSGELEEKLGWAAKASLRVATINLCDLGALARDGQRTVTTDLTAAGRDLLAVADALERWLSHSPFGPLELSDAAARGTVRALVAGWESTIIRALAERPRSLAELSSEIPSHSYPALKRRFSKLRTATLVVCVDDRARSPEHEVTPWLRRAVGPLSLAARWERDHAPTVPSFDEYYDLEAALLLALPLVELPPDASGSCVLAAPMARESGEDPEPSLAAISLVIEEGKIASLGSGANSTPATWALGSADAWLDALIEGRLDDLRIHGSDADLTASLVSRIHQDLFQTSPKFS